MKNEVQFKVCGLTRVTDACAAAAAGASYLGFIFYPKSPRRIELEEFLRIAAGLPDLPKVAVTVAPSLDELTALKEAGFDFFQLHFSTNDAGAIAEWSALVGRDRLWLAPKISPEETFNPTCLEFANTILWDGYKKDASTYGGTGTRSNWAIFRELKAAYTNTRWILAGGLSPENAVEALRKTDASVLDFNSGLEISPGIKDQDRIAQVRSVLLGSQ